MGVLRLLLAAGKMDDCKDGGFLKKWWVKAQLPGPRKKGFSGRKIDRSPRVR
jgi:hypothetical protein